MLGVVRDDHLYTRADLEDRLGRYDQHYESIGFRTLVMPTLRGALRAVTGWLSRERPPAP